MVHNKQIILILQVYAKKRYGLTYHRHNRGEENTKHTQGGNTDPGSQAVGHVTGQYQQSIGQWAAFHRCL